MYNGERFLRECIESILAQTYSDFELLLVDDGSTDQTRSIAESYVGADSRVRLVVNAQNLGLVGNWNRCIELAQGEWIKFVFQDDALFPDCLTQMLHAARDGIVFVACQRTLVFDEGTAQPLREAYEVHRALMADLFANNQFLSPEQFQRWALERFGVNPLAEPTSVLIHRSAFDDARPVQPGPDHVLRFRDVDSDRDSFRRGARAGRTSDLPSTQSVDDSGKSRLSGVSNGNSRRSGAAASVRE